MIGKFALTTTLLRAHTRYDVPSLCSAGTKHGQLWEALTKGKEAEVCAIGQTILTDHQPLFDPTINQDHAPTHPSLVYRPIFAFHSRPSLLPSTTNVRYLVGHSPRRRSYSIYDTPILSSLTGSIKHFLNDVMCNYLPPSAESSPPFARPRLLASSASPKPCVRHRCPCHHKPNHNNK